MQFFFLILALCLGLFLFRLYHLSSDDYVLIKKNITLEDVFNAAFFSSVFALLFARIFYVVFHFTPNFLNPLVFFIFPYFPGLSLLGGLVGGAISIYLYGKNKKFPTKRVFDFFTAAFLSTLPVALLGHMVLSGSFTHGEIARLVLISLFLVFTNFYLYPKAHSLEIKDGSLSLIFIIFYSLISLLSNSIDNPGIGNFIKNKENFIQVGVLFFGMIMILKQEILGRIETGK